MIKVKSQFQVKAGDFLISKRQIVHGACGIVPSQLDGAIVSGEYAVLGTNGGVSLPFLKHLSASVHFQQTCFHSSIGVHVEKMVFKLGKWLQWDFNIPPLPEQKKIASILTTVDDKISSIDQQIQQTEQLKKGLMEKLLTEGIGHTEFKDTKIGWIPEDWDWSAIGEKCELKTGATPSRKNNEYWDNGTINWLASGEVHKRYIYNVDSQITLTGHQNSNTHILPINTIVIALNGQGKTRGKVAVVKTETACNQSLGAFICQNELFYSFLFFYLENQYQNIRDLTGEGRNGLNLKILRNINIPIPPLKEQKQIASILSTVDDKIEVLNQKKTQYQTLKKGLSQQLLTGQMRVKI